MRAELRVKSIEQVYFMEWIALTYKQGKLYSRNKSIVEHMKVNGEMIKIIRARSLESCKPIASD